MSLRPRDYSKGMQKSAKATLNSTSIEEVKSNGVFCHTLRIEVDLKSKTNKLD